MGTWLKNEDIISCFYAPDRFIHDLFEFFRPDNKYYSPYGLGVYVSEQHFVGELGYIIDAINYIRNKSQRALPKNLWLFMYLGEGYAGQSPTRINRCPCWKNTK